MASTPTPEALEVRRKGRRRLIGAFASSSPWSSSCRCCSIPAPREQKQDMSLAIPAKDAVAPLPPPLEKPKAREDDARRRPQASRPRAPPNSQGCRTSRAGEPRPSRWPRSPRHLSAPAKVAVVPEATAAVADPVPAKAAESTECRRIRRADRRIQGRCPPEAGAGQANAAKVKHYTELIATSSGDLTRLRAGPYPTREAADKAPQQLKRSGVEGKVVPLP